MKNFKTFMTLFVVMAALTATFGIMMYNAFIKSVRFYGYQPGDLKTLIAALVIFSVGVGVSGYLLTKALGWLILARRFKKEFGFDPPTEHFIGYGAQVSVETTLASIRQYQSVKKYVDTALLAEKFGFLVNWPPEYRNEYARTHR